MFSHTAVVTFVTRKTLERQCQLGKQPSGIAAVYRRVRTKAVLARPVVRPSRFVEMARSCVLSLERGNTAIGERRDGCASMVSR